MRLHPDEKMVLELRPARGLIVLWLISRCLPLALGVGGLVLFITSSIAGDLLPGVYVGCPVAAVTFALSAVYHVFLRRSYAYYITSRRCVFHGGILLEVERSVPYHKITNVETSRNIIERAVGISRPNLIAPGTGGARSGLDRLAEISFVGLRDSETPAWTVSNMLRSSEATDE